MWELVPSIDYEKRAKRYLKTNRQEMLNVADNLAAFRMGLKPQQIIRGFVHHEPHGIKALDESGPGKHKKALRLYIYPDERSETLYELIEDTFDDDPQFVDDLKTQINRRQIVRGLATLRNSKNITQEEIAEKMRCAQRRVSKIENGLDDDLRLSDILAYLKVLNYNAEISLLPSDMTVVGEIKYYARQMNKAFDKLTSLALKDDTIREGIAKFYNEA